MTIGFNASARLECAGTDVDTAIALLEQGFGSQGFAARELDAPFSFRITAVGDAAMTLRGSRLRGRVEGTIEPADEYIVTWLTTGQGYLDVGRDEVELRPGIPMMFPVRRFSFSFADYEQNLIHFDRTFLERLAAERNGTEPMPLRVDHTAAPTPGALEGWRAAVRVVARAFLGEQPLSSEVRDDLARVAGNAALDTFAIEQVPFLDTDLGGPRLRAALAFMHASAGSDIGSADIAAAAGLSVRGLQQAFHRHLGESPTAFLRAIRLDRAHGELTALDPQRATVAQVARRWGFGHLGRFSATYAERFGEYPRDTLHR